MAKLPTLLPLDPKRPGPATDSVVLAVFAPFGSDKVLSTWPRDVSDPQPQIKQQAIVESLKNVAKQGVHVAALVDLVDDFSWYIELPAAKSLRPPVLCSVWKQDMSDPHSLAGFLAHVQQRFPRSDVVLALEGHGAGYIPDIDGSKITVENFTRNGGFEWTQSEGGTRVDPSDPAPPLTMVSPELTMVSPELPSTRMPMSTPGMARALRLAQSRGARRPAVIHFNNCFNLSVEVMHTVAPYADYATAYANYNFFTAGAAYTSVFAQLRAAGTATREQLARWFAETNQVALETKGRHPTIGGMLRLSSMRGLGTLIDKLAAALAKALQDAIADPVAFADATGAIRAAILQAQQYDTDQDYRLEVPDQLTDLRALAQALTAQVFVSPDVVPAAAALAAAMAGIRVYGTADVPYPAPGEFWDFKNPPLAMNILLPDPRREGVWDWRSPYYLRSRFDPKLPSALKSDIPFLAKGRWVDFIDWYHRGVAFKGYQPARSPVFPVFEIERKPGTGNNRPPRPPRPNKR